MKTDHILRQIYKELREEIKKSSSDIFIKTYMIPSRNYNLEKENLWFASGIQRSIKYMLERLDNKVYCASYKDEYFFGNNEEKVQEKMLNKIDKDKKIKKNERKSKKDRKNEYNEPDL